MLFLALLGFVAFGQKTFTAPQYVSQKEYDAFNALNALRAQGYTCKSGAYFAPNPTPLQFDCRLWRASQLHSQDQAYYAYFSHDSRDGRDFTQRAAAQGVSTSAENIAAGNASPQAAIDQWRGSASGHCEGQMDPGHRLVGIGYAYNPQDPTYLGSYWTANFAGANQLPADTSCIPPSGVPMPQPVQMPIQPTPYPTAAGAPAGVLNPGVDCWNGCRGRGGYCDAFCGTGNACCKQGFAQDPPECKTVQNYYGFTSFHVCVVPGPSTGPTGPRCDPKRVDYGCCTSSQKCGGGEGDCDRDNECLSGTCHYDVGAAYGAPASFDICGPLGPAQPVTAPTPTPTLTGGLTPVLNKGQDCWGSCWSSGGYCSYCGQGNACCRPGWTADPAECSLMDFTGAPVYGHTCVGPKSNPVPSPTPRPTSPTPRPTSPTPYPTSPTPYPTSPTPRPTMPRPTPKPTNKPQPTPKPTTPAPVPSPTPAVTPAPISSGGLMNKGLDCWGGCSFKGGFCSFCGTGACCRPGWTADPAECKLMDFTGALPGHSCVGPKSNPVPNPTPAPVSPTPYPTMPTPRPTTPAPVPSPTPAVTPAPISSGGLMNKGIDCWGGCKYTGGFCPNFCGTGACCRRGWPTDPAECKLMDFTGAPPGHSCVGPKVVPTPRPTPPPVPRPTPSPVPAVATPAPTIDCTVYSKKQCKKDRIAKLACKALKGICLPRTITTCNQYNPMGKKGKKSCTKSSLDCSWDTANLQCLPFDCSLFGKKEKTCNKQLPRCVWDTKNKDCTINTFCDRTTNKRDCTNMVALAYNQFCKWDAAAGVCYDSTLVIVSCTTNSSKKTCKAAGCTWSVGGCS